MLLGFCVCSSWINFNTHFFFYGLLPPIILYPPPTTTKGFCKTHLACCLKLAGILIHREKREHKCVYMYMCTCMCMCAFLYWTKKISLTKTGKNWIRMELTAGVPSLANCSDCRIFKFSLFWFFSFFLLHSMKASIKKTDQKTNLIVLLPQSALPDLNLIIVLSSSLICTTTGSQSDCTRSSICTTGCQSDCASSTWFCTSGSQSSSSKFSLLKFFLVSTGEFGCVSWF